MEDGFEVFSMSRLGPSSFDMQAKDAEYQAFMAEHYPESVDQGRRA